MSPGNPMPNLNAEGKIQHMKFHIGRAISTIEAAISAARDTAKSTDYATELLEKAIERLEAIRHK